MPDFASEPHSPQLPGSGLCLHARSALPLARRALALLTHSAATGSGPEKSLGRGEREVGARGREAERRGVRGGRAGGAAAAGQGRVAERKQAGASRARHDAARLSTHADAARD
eukprot:790585-Rhodomonas_salina.2